MCIGKKCCVSQDHKVPLKVNIPPKWLFCERVRYDKKRHLIND